MSLKPRQLILTLIGLAVMGVAGWTWFESHGTQLVAGEDALAWVVVLAITCLMGAISLQILRTSLLLQTTPRALARPLLMAHGLNIWLPSMMGDLFEVWAVAVAADRSKRATLVLLGHRFAGTLSALGILAAIAVAGRLPSLAVGFGAMSILGYLAVDATVSRWVGWLRVPAEDGSAPPQPLGPRRTLGHLGLATVQHGIEALGFFLLGIATGCAVSPAAAAGMVSIIELVTYLPIPLGGAGAQHWGASMVLEWGAPGTRTALLVASAHGLHVGLGTLAIGIAFVLGRDSTPPNTA
jgi:hypothetical protein